MSGRAAMRKTATAYALTTLLALVVVPSACPKVLMLAYPPLHAVATADVVVVGTVTAVSEKTEQADLVKGDGREMKVATVKVQSALLGKKPGTTVKVGFFVPPKIRVKGDRTLRASLTKGQEVMLILTRHPKKKGVYYLAHYYDVMVKGRYAAPLGKEGVGDWRKRLGEYKKAIRLVADPMKGLKSKDASERLLTATLLIYRYTTPASPGAKTEAVPAAESKLILKALAEANWGRRHLDAAPFVSPRALFFRLNLTDKDGWRQPADLEQTDAVAKRWLKENAGKFKMTRYARPKVSVEISEEPGK